MGDAGAATMPAPFDPRSAMGGGPAVKGAKYQSDALEWARIIAHLVPRVEHLGVHPDVVEAAVRSAWVSYDGSRVQQFRAILTEREAYRRILHYCTIEPADYSGPTALPAP